MLKEARLELRFIEEALAGRRVAAAHAIRMLGFDETTKYGNAGITSNVIIEPTKGAPLAGATTVERIVLSPGIAENSSAELWSRAHVARTDRCFRIAIENSVWG